MASKPALRPIDNAVASATRMVAALTRAKQSNYPPATTAHLYTAIHEHAQLKFHMDRQLQAEGSLWAKTQNERVEKLQTGIDHVLAPDIAKFYNLHDANEATRLRDQGGIVPPSLAEEGTGEVTEAEGDAIAAAMGSDDANPCEQTRRTIQQMGGGKIPVEAV